MPTQTKPSGFTGWWSTFPVRERDRSQTNHTLYSGGNLQAGNLGSQVPKTYQGPSPPAGPPHKYNFVVYDQKGNSLPANQPPPSPPSTGFDRRSWSSTNNLEQTATNFFLERAWIKIRIVPHLPMKKNKVFWMMLTLKWMNNYFRHFNIRYL